MESMSSKENGIPRIESLKVQNFRSLQDVTLDKLTPLTVLLGPNGSGKSTIFDVFNFLSECFQFGLRHAWDRRGKGKELKTRGEDGPIVFELTYRESPKTPKITYHLAIDEGIKGPEVVEEWLQWRRASKGQPFRFLEFKRGIGRAISGEVPEADDIRTESNLRSPDLIAVNTLGQLTDHPRVAALREFITTWYVSYLSIDQTKNQPEAGPQERLSKSGDNLPNVIQYLKEMHPHRLEKIFTVLRKRIPHLERVDAEPMPDGRLLLQIKDAPFEKPVLSKFASDGTMKMLAYLTVLYDPEPPRFVGIEEPENFLHPRLLPELAEECRAASENSQLLITSHSPFLLNAMRAEEVRVLYRDEHGFTQAVRASDITGIPELIQAGSSLGHLWMEGHFGFGDPMVNSGAPKTTIKGA
ncbi:MAG: ATPase [Candidatus Wallbacteria bacterium HGW-Wallbacteria-1]|jgi:predicted ATPase|uniref:ATPase n=1 Tax=Candidatus Wallbacteria bacterium HGW-Wallbacteria-1 TaxID=2013854 RepID=A0A2N1PI16_9BACT|nr:MAG: ATPase [Candidatus Wallbacteria bacterium HGW-Wallbacteria-1]PKL27062.1 MAG: ATPase [Spirochaetae bacterium HGW-Spirochaetae-2]